ncbi:unnamed protein product [Nesidiocoris tenuis]|uniref:Cilia- and flagella-associated protein 52 n=1 Tax=Nesidiocoris tenuis TaxID=355587 RepID=A0A6H5GGV1_9HEMI|nr:unnamed protein product [Nesidiocoris tenuis]
MKGLKVHPGGRHMIYPFGMKVAVVHMDTKAHRYLEGHTNVITTVAVSKSGRFVAAGQVNHMGFKAPVFVWDFESGEVKMSHESHKVRVENVAFSSCERYVISLGGKDDANVCVFDIETKDAICGVRSLLIMPQNRLIVGSGEGLVEYVGQKAFKPTNKVEKGTGISNPTTPLFVVLKGVCVGGLVTSMQLMNDRSLIVGTIKCEMFIIDIESFTAHLYLTCHTTAVFAIAFPSDYSDVFATASKNDVRVWSVSKSRELLRISVPNFTCSCLTFTYDGRSIVTGWNDGTVRGFTPQSGKLIYTIEDAHNKGVSALDLTKDGRTLMTGGQGGQIRVWCIRKDVQKLIAVLKEHKGPVSSLQISPNDLEAASASTDGSCIIWDLVKCVRIAIMFSTTLFLCIRFHPSGCQLLTTGTNRQIAYWETFDGALIREIEGSRSAALNTLDISSDGVYVASGGNDQYVKLWLYKEGIPIYIGLGHGAVITAVSISPDGRTIVSASADGAIFIWRSPTDPETKTESKTTVSTPHSQQSKEKLPVSKEKSRTPSRARLAKLKFSDSHSSKCEREEKSYFSTKHTFWKHYFFSSKESVGSKNESDVKKELAKACRGMESVKGKLEKIKAEREAAELASVKNEDSCDEDQGGGGDSKMCGKYSPVSPRLV